MLLSYKPPNYTILIVKKIRIAAQYLLTYEDSDYFSLWPFSQILKSAQITTRNWSFCPFLCNLAWIYLGIKLCLKKKTLFSKRPKHYAQAQWINISTENESASIRMKPLWSLILCTLWLHRRVNARPGNYSISTTSTITIECLPWELSDLIRATVYGARNRPREYQPNEEYFGSLTKEQRQKHLVLVVQRIDNAFYRINHYPLDRH